MGFRGRRRGFPVEGLLVEEARVQEGWRVGNEKEGKPMEKRGQRKGLLYDSRTPPPP